MPILHKIKIIHKDNSKNTPLLIYSHTLKQLVKKKCLCPSTIRDGGGPSTLSNFIYDGGSALTSFPSIYDGGTPEASGVIVYTDDNP